MEVINVIVVGIALASLWYWAAVLLRLTHPDKGIWQWIKIFVPQGIMLAWAIKIVMEMFRG